MGSIAADNAEINGSARPRVLEIFAAAKQDGRPVYVSAPMVRYSKLPFRLLARQYGTDITYIPMMLAHEFIRSSIARDSDFTTHPLEREPTTDGRQHAVIAQFASSEPEEFARAAEMIAPWVDGVDLNCGCPQSWAIKESIGCALMEDAPKVAAIVRAAKQRLPPSKSVSVKIRIHKDLNQTIGWLCTVLPSGVDYITLHARTRTQRSSTPPNFSALATLRPYIPSSIPMLANGDAYTLSDVHRITSLTGADGIMAARGILQNPALFTGVEATPVQCVRDFLTWAVKCPIPFPLVLHHVSDMTAKMEGGAMMTKKVKKELMECKDLVDLIDYVEDK